MLICMAGINVVSLYHFPQGKYRDNNSNFRLFNTKATWLCPIKVVSLYYRKLQD